MIKTQCLTQSIILFWGSCCFGQSIESAPGDKQGSREGTAPSRNVVRDADRSSLAFHLAAYDRNVLQAAAAATVLWIFWRTHQAGWQLVVHLRTLLIAHVGVVATAKNFHNNYVIWFLPLVGLYALAVLMEARAQAAMRDPAEGADG